jgi:predicted phosphodiesterase
MKLAVLSDIHGNLLALRAVLVDVARQGVDQIVHLGDLLSGPLQPAETADLLMAQNLPIIRGNHERQVLALLDQGRPLDPLDTDGYTAAQLRPEHIRWLRTLPASLALTPDVLLCHGTPHSDLDYWLESTEPGFGQGHATGLRAATQLEVAARLGGVPASLVLCGHTHVPRAVQVGTPHARYAVVQRCAVGWQVDLRAVPYDHGAQAYLADSRGRPDWAYALRTGWAMR